MAVNNILPRVVEKFNKIVTDYKVTEAFILNNELYTTSEYQIPFSEFQEIEKYFLNQSKI